MARSYEEAAKEYKKLAWKLDKQLYRLEKASRKEEYKGITEFAHKRMIQEIQNWSSGNTRWGQSLPKDSDPAKALEKLEKKIAIMKHLEKLPSFSIKKVKKIYGGAAKTINEKYGVELSWRDIATFYGSEEAKVMDSKYGSDTIVMALGQFKKMSTEEVADLATYIKKYPHLKLDDDIAISNAIKELIKLYT